MEHLSTQRDEINKELENSQAVTDLFTPRLTNQGIQTDLSFGVQSQDLSGVDELNMNYIQVSPPKTLTERNPKKNKQLRKLKAEVKFLTQLSKKTTQALLESEEQNYQFRLILQKLNKERQLEDLKTKTSEGSKIEKDVSELLGEAADVDSLIEEWSSLATAIFQLVSVVPVSQNSPLSLMFPPATFREAHQAINHLMQYSRTIKKREDEWDSRLCLLKDKCSRLVLDMTSSMDEFGRSKVESRLKWSEINGIIS